MKSNPLIESNFTCPWWLLFTFDNPFRSLLMNPRKLLSPYIRPGDTILDVGCGMGFCSLELARLTGATGKVYAADLQMKMLEGLQKRAQVAGLEEQIKPWWCGPEQIGIPEPVDVVLAMWMVHEVSNRRAFIDEIYSLLKVDGILLIVEPIIHVGLNNFNKTLQICNEVGFMEFSYPNVALSRAVVFIK